MNRTFAKAGRLSLVAIAALIMQLFIPFLASTATASSPNHAVVRLDRMSATMATGGSICVMPQSSSTISSVTVVFPTTSATDFVVNGTNTNWTTTNTPTSGWPSGAVAMGGIVTPAASANNGTKTVVFTTNQTTPSTSTYYCFNFGSSSTLTTSSAGATPSVYGSVATNADTTGAQYSLSIVASDQLALTATIVPPIFTMSFAANTDNFATNTLALGLNNSTGKAVSASTNASGGWVMWARGSNVGTSSKQSLKSVAASKQIQSASAVNTAAHPYSAGTEDYGISTTTAACTSGGTPTADPAYDSAADTKLGVLADNTGAFYRVAALTSASDTCPVTFKFVAGINVTTPAAGDYTDTITIVGAGLF